jgi:hypothetical protein
MTTIESPDDVLLAYLKSYYNDFDNLEKMFRLITSDTKISLRIIDWLVTNYSKKNHTNYMVITKNGESKRFVIYQDYKLMLKSFSKRFFDPFCRHDRIKFHYIDNKYFDTTLGQLNFFKWILENKIDEYLEEHYEEVNMDMISRISASKKNVIKNDSGIKTRKNREELSALSTKSIKKEYINTTISFNII